MSINQKYIKSNSVPTSQIKSFSIDWGSENIYKAIKIIIPVIFIVLIVWMSISRISNINETFVSRLSNETKYEYTDDATITKVAKQNILVYTNEKPNNLKEIKANDNSKYMYVLPADSNILEIRSSGFGAFRCDLVIVLVILSVIYSIFIRHYKDLKNGYKKINNQLFEFNGVFENIIEKNDTEKDKFNKFKDNYDEILNSIKGNKRKGKEGIEYIGSLWWEFCETLMIKRKENNNIVNPNEYHENNPVTKLRNTDQVEVYINSENIVDRQLSREMIDVTPGILTGLGLVGTFSAIAIALMGFNIGNIELSIQNLLGGLSIKFISSLAGIGTSILFLFIKSKLFSNLEKNISDIQLELNSIFPRRTAESYLCYIWEEIERSNERLEDLEDYAENQKNLADGFIANMSAKIKEVLENSVQKDIKEVLDSLNDSLSKSISSNLEAPLMKLIEVMEDVKNTKEESSTKAITDVLERIFNKDSFKHASSSMAEGITEGIDASVSRMNEQEEKIGDLVQQISNYVTQLHNYEASVEEHYRDLLENLNKAVNTQTDFVNKNHEYVNALADASNKISSTSSNLDIVSDRFNEASEDFSQAMGNVSTIVDTSESIVNNTADLNNNLERVFEKFKEKAEASIEGVFNEFGTNISEICGKIQTAVGGLEEVDFDELKDSIETLSEILKEKQGS